MRNILLTHPILMITLWTSCASWATQEVPSPTKTPNGSLSTNIQFSGSEVQGKYQVPADSVVNVEKEKKLMSLIAPRYHFKDRLRRAQGQR